MPSAKDYSLWGDGMWLAGPTVPYLLVFLKAIQQSLPDVVLHENIKQFPIALIEKELSRFFSEFHSLFLSVAM